MKKKEKQTFEDSLSALEKIVRGLEDGDLPLEESLKLFEDGVRLARECRERLDQAERRIEVLLEGDDGGRIEPLEDSNLRAAAADIKKRIVFDDDESAF